MKKVAIFTGYFIPHLGGIERYLEQMVKELAKLDYKITIIASNHDHLESYEKCKDYEIYRIPVRKLFHTRYPIPYKNTEFKQMWNEWKEKEFDQIIVNTRFFLTSFLGAKLGEQENIPVFLIEHGCNHLTVNNKILDYFGSLYEHAITRHIKKKITAFYAVSESCGKWLNHFHITCDGVVTGAINPKDAKEHVIKKEKKKTIITYAGRMLKQKGVLNLLDAFVKEFKDREDVELHLAGTGNLDHYIREHYQDSNIMILGQLPYSSLLDLLGRTNIFVYPPIWPEGFGLSVVEAGMMKCAVIGAKQFGIQEIICSSEYGLLNDCSVEALAHDLKNLVEDSKLQKKLGENLQKRVFETFTWESSAKKLDILMERDDPR